MPANTEINQTRPTTIDEIIGQQSVIQQVKVGLGAARADGSKFPHSLLTGPPGLGKSLCAAIISKEIGTELHETLAQTVTNAAEMHAILLGADSRDVVFLDEAHELSYSVQTILYRAIDERRIYLQPECSQYKPKSVPLADFTLLLASTDAHALLSPLSQRLRLTLHFDFYDEQELAVLVGQRASMLQWDVEHSVLERIAELGRGTPRIALRLLEAAWRVSRSVGENRVTESHFRRSRELQGLDEQGLDVVEQRYLHLLYDARGSMRVGVLAAKLGLPVRTISQVVEPYLLRIGFIERQDMGRKLTHDGWVHAAEKVDPAAAQRAREG